MKIFLFVMSMVLSGFLLAEPKVSYVGLGRYSCSGSDRECEPIRRRNESLELQRQQTRELELQRRELQTQTEVLRNQQRYYERERSSRW